MLRLVAMPCLRLDLCSRAIDALSVASGGRHHNGRARSNSFREWRLSEVRLPKVEHLDAIGFERIVGNTERISLVIADTAIASGDPRSRCRAALVIETLSRRDLDVIRRTPDRIAQPPMNPAGTFKN